MKIKTIIFTSFILLLSCTKNNKPEISDLQINIDSIVNLDYNNAFFDGFRVPSDKEKEIEFQFRIPEKRKLFYKIYYQNESYKFPEQSSKLGVNGYNNLASENFYGTFSNPYIEFLPVTDSIVKGSFAIQGNPRDEQKYYGNPRVLYVDFDKEVSKYIEKIKSSKDWYESVKQKAVKNNISLEKQLKKDAEWVVNDEIKKKKINNRWQRNPRVGKYSFLLVVTTESDLKKIPDYIKNITKTKDGIFINPYYYFLYGDGKNLTETNIVKIDNFTKLRASVPKNGIYVDYNSKRHTDTSHFGRYVGNSDYLYANAGFAYYENERLYNQVVHNIPVIAEYFGTNAYTEEDYKKNIEKYDDKRVDIYFQNSSAPGATFGVDTTNNTLYFFNPPSTPDNMRKENVGLKTRNGFTYGKYTVKIKMAELLNKHNVWTGVTNAIWMLSESLEPWNNRRKCWVKNRGYKPYYGASKEEKTVEQMAYSEIDFEIVKAAQYWPKTSYHDKKERPEPESNKDKVMVACTNWDLSCWAPEDYGVGVNKISYNDKTFDIHRWDHWYSALTSKVPKKDDELFAGDYYYFQLEWKPNEIIWRVGPEKDKLEVVGYMNDKVTSIPNNQMIMIITQEYHQSSWWPNAPFVQENLPFTAKPLNGVLYDIEIE